GGFCLPDPDGEKAILVDGLEEHDRLLADRLEAHAVEGHLAHPDVRMLVRGRTPASSGGVRQSQRASGPCAVSLPLGSDSTCEGMGDPGLEPGASALSERRSNRLS